MKGKTLLFGILAAAAAGIAADVCAQQNLRSGAVVTDAVIARHRDSVTVSMTFNLDNMKIRRGGTVILQSMYVQSDGTQSAWLPPVEVKDRVRDIYLQRNPETAFADEVYCSVVKKRNEPMSVDYIVTLPYDEWMDSSRLQVTEGELVFSALSFSEKLPLGDFAFSSLPSPVPAKETGEPENAPLTLGFSLAEKDGEYAAESEGGEDKCFFRFGRRQHTHKSDFDISFRCGKLITLRRAFYCFRIFHFRLGDGMHTQNIWRHCLSQAFQTFLRIKQLK